MLHIQVAAEEYLFTTSEDFPMMYDTSIEVVNSNHRVYTASSLSDIQYLIDAGIVTYCEPMSYSELFDYIPEDTYFSEQLNLTQVSAPFSWNKGVFGDSVKIAVIDSGIYNAASDFNTQKIIKAKDYTSTASSSVTFCNDEIGHGTMVTGVLAASHNSWGVAGIAPNVEIYVFKCFYLNEYGNKTAKNSDIIDAVYEAIDNYGVDIINFSAGTTNSNVFKAMSDYAESKGILLIAAAGNDGNLSSNVYYPAAYDNVIGVGSIDSGGHRATHSQRNDLVNIMAPGEDIYSVHISGYQKGTGTSYATPHVAAAAALAKSLNPDLTLEQITNALYSSCNYMPDRYSGHGSLNIQALLTYVQATKNPDKLVYSSSDTSYFAYCIPSGDYVAYFARYNNGMMTDIKKDGINALTADFKKYIYYIWKKGSLEPYSGEITALEY